MGWSNAFLTEINSPTRSPVWALEAIRLLSGGVGGERDYTSHMVVGSGYSPHLKIGSVRTGGARLNPLSWTSTQGAFSVELFGDVSDILLYYSRGTVVRLMLGFEGWDPSQFQPVGLGVVKNVRGSPPKWSLECWDLVQALQNRITDDATKLELFYGVGTQTELSSAHAVGVATVQVDDASGFSKESTAVGRNGYGLLYITPNLDEGISTVEEPFYLRYSDAPDESANEFTDVEADDLLGTTAGIVPIDSTVDEVAYIEGHPMESLAKILTSTGVTDYNGAFDTLPVSWGYGLPKELVDTDDIELMKTAFYVAAGIRYEYSMVSHEPQSNGLQWIQSQLSGAGIFLTQRQGQLTARVVQDPNGTEAEPVTSELEIGDSDIMGVAYEAWDSQQPAEYDIWNINYHGAAASGIPYDAALPDEEVQTLPVALSYESFAAIDVDHDHAAEMITEVSKRLKYWYWRVAERLTLTCAGLRLAQLCPGDIVTITSTILYGRREAKMGTSLGFEGRRAMVYGVDPDWIGGTVTVILAILPDYGD